MKNVRTARRVFLGASLAAGLGIYLWPQSNTETKLFKNDVQVLLHAAYHLFPQSKLGPGAIDLKISGYLSMVLKDERILEEDRHYLLQGAVWLEQRAVETFNKSFLNLAYVEKEKLFQEITEYRWGVSFVRNTLTYVFEALLCSPVYGSNPNEVGWKWLDHNPGFPQPSMNEEIVYDV